MRYPLYPLSNPQCKYSINISVILIYMLSSNRFHTFWLEYMTSREWTLASKTNIFVMARWVNHVTPWRLPPRVSPPWWFNHERQDDSPGPLTKEVVELPYSLFLSSIKFSVVRKLNACNYLIIVKKCINRKDYLCKIPKIDKQKLELMKVVDYVI